MCAMMKTSETAVGEVLYDVGGGKPVSKGALNYLPCKEQGRTPKGEDPAEGLWQWETVCQVQKSGQDRSY